MARLRNSLFLVDKHIWLVNKYSGFCKLVTSLRVNKDVMTLYSMWLLDDPDDCAENYIGLMKDLKVVY